MISSVIFLKSFLVAKKTKKNNCHKFVAKYLWQKNYHKYFATDEKQK